MRGAYIVYTWITAKTGRWWQINSETENMDQWSPYASLYDNARRYSDPLGNEPRGGNCPTCPIDNPAMWPKTAEETSDVWGAIGEGFKSFLVSAGGILNGGLKIQWPWCMA